MPIDFNDIRSQLRPGFTPVNSALLVVLFFLAWPLALAMLAYVVAGHRIGLDLGKPESYASAFGRLRIALKGAVNGFQSASESTPNSGNNSGNNGTPASAYQNLQREKDKLSAERSTLEGERQAFEAEKQAWLDEKERQESAR